MFNGQTAQDHLDWCVTRAMDYAEMGDMAQAWASFGSDVRKHPGTKHIAENPFFGMAMLSGQYNDAVAFKHFNSGWAVNEDLFTNEKNWRDD